MISPPMFVPSLGVLLDHHAPASPLAFVAALAEPSGNSQKERRREADG